VNKCLFLKLLKHVFTKRFYVGTLITLYTVDPYCWGFVTVITSTPVGPSLSQSRLLCAVNCGLCALPVHSLVHSLSAEERWRERGRTALAAVNCVRRGPCVIICRCRPPPSCRPAAVTNDVVSATPSDEIDLRCWTADADAAAADDDSDNGSDVSHPACVLSTPRAVKCFIALSLSLTALLLSRIVGRFNHLTPTVATWLQL